MNKKLVISLITLCVIVVGGIWAVKSKNHQLASRTQMPLRTDVKAAIGPEPASIDPAINIDTYVSIYISHLSEGLTKYNDKNEIVPAMAERWEVSEDGLVYTFFLKDNVKWSDGVPVTAKDFEYEWKRVLDPKTASKYADPLFYIKGAEDFNKGIAKEVGITSINDKTLQVTLERPTSFFTSLVSIQPFFPVRQDIVEKYGDTWSQNQQSHVSNGPFVLTAWNHNQNILMSKNENYYDKDLVKLQTINWKMVDNDTAALNAFDVGELDFHTGFINTNELPRLYTEKKATKLDALGVSYVIFNVKNKPFDNVKVRQALSLAIDRQGLVDVMQDGSRVAEGYISYGVPSFEKGSDFRTDKYAQKFISDKPNLEEAKRLLAEAGYPDGKGLDEFVFLTAKDSTNVKIAEYMQDQWAKINVRIKINAIEQKVRNELRAKGEFDITKGSWGSDYLDPNSFLYGFVSASPNNYGRWASKAYDEKVSASVGSKDLESEFKYAHEAEKIMMDEMPIVPLFYPSFNILMNPNLKSVYVNSLRRVMFTDAYWAN